MAEPEGGQNRTVSEEKWRSRWDCLIGKWIGDKTPQLGAKIRIPSVLNEIFKYTLARGGILLKGWMWRICETMTGSLDPEGSELTQTV